MRVYVITAVHVENNEVSKIKGYLLSVNFSLSFPPSQFPVEFSRSEMITLIRQGNIFDLFKNGKTKPLFINTIKNTVSLEVAQFAEVEKF